MQSMPGSILGTRVTRVEDPDLITGHGSYVGDVRVDGLAAIAFVRSPIAHGRPLAGAAVVVRARMENQRVAVAPMEGNAITVVPGDDGAGHDLTVYVSTQMPHLFAQIAAGTLGLDLERIRVITPDVGGGFGGKA